MPEKNFEKQMTDILGSMQMQPDESVWAEVQNRIAEKSRRRRPVLWIAVLSVFVSGSLFYFIYSGNPVTEKPVVKAEEKKTNQKEINIASDSTISNETFHTETRRINKEERIVKKVTAETSNISIASIKRTVVSQNTAMQKNLSESKVSSNEDISKEQSKKQANSSTMAGVADSKVLTGSKDSLTETSATDKKTADNNKRNENADASASAIIKLSKPSPKWEKGIFISGGSFSYTNKLNVLGILGGSAQKSNLPANSSAANPSGSFTTTTSKQHATNGYHIAAGFFVQRNFKHFSLRADLSFEYAAFENYKTNTTATYVNASASSQSSVFQLANSTSVDSKQSYKFLGITINPNISGLIVNGENKSLRWELGLPQQILVNREVTSPVMLSQTYSTSLSAKKITYQPGIDLGISVTTEGKHKINFGPYFIANLKTVETDLPEKLRIYKAGLRLKYFLR